ncbi:MAG TPA: hypothetical protein VL983_11175 [Terriglobales bacterium]|nr:hypothetical protein [Terriglobales bacterium]
MPPALLILRQVNQSVRNALLRFRPEIHHCSTIRSGEFSSLLAQLLRAKECLRSLEAKFSSGRDVMDENATALTNEMQEYHANLNRLKHLLPDMQLRLLAEKARLQAAQSHVVAASAWAGTSKKTL